MFNNGEGERNKFVEWLIVRIVLFEKLFFKFCLGFIVVRRGCLGGRRCWRRWYLFRRRYGFRRRGRRYWLIGLWGRRGWWWYRRWRYWGRRGRGRCRGKYCVWIRRWRRWGRRGMYFVKVWDRNCVILYVII